MIGEKKLLILHCYGVYHRGAFYADYPEYTEIYKQQLRKSVCLLTNGDFDTLIISGGYTKSTVEKSEARGMLDWAEYLGLWPAEKGLILLDSLVNRKNSTDIVNHSTNIPASVTSCTWKFNIERFEILAKKLHIPEFNVVPVGERENQEEIAQKLAELARQDPLYYKQTDSKEKYLSRDPWKRSHPYCQISPAFRILFAALSEIKIKRGNLKEVENILPWK